MKRNSNHIYLPNEIVTEILLRLPAKSLGQCKCVCRSWYNLIQTPDFVKNHFDQPRNQTRLFAFYCDENRPWEPAFTLFNDESFSLREDVCNPLYTHGKINDILGPANGLYMISYSYENVALWNPSTSEFRKLRMPAFDSRHSRYFSLESEHFGFGYIDKNVKVISIKTFGLDKELDSLETVVTLYSLADDCRKNVECNSVYISDIGEGKGTYLNGVYYWPVDHEDDIMLLFDMETEKFREVKIPHLTNDMYEAGLSVRGNSSIILCVHERLGDDDDDIVTNVHLWEMKEEGEWVKLLTFDPSSARLYAEVYGFWKKDEIIIQDENGNVLLYDINSHKSRDLEIGMPHTLIFLNYKESLTSVRRSSVLKYYEEIEGTISDIYVKSRR